MPKSKPPAGSESQPAPDEPKAVLFYTGDASGEPYIHGIPARDLTKADIARLAFVESTRVGKKVTPAKVLDRLAETDLYRKTAPVTKTRRSAPKKAKPSPASTPEPAIQPDASTAPASEE